MTQKMKLKYPTGEALMTKVEAARGEIYRNLAVLECVAQAMEGEMEWESQDGPCYPDALRIGIEGLKAAADSLDSVLLPNS